ncbi:MAG TPA: hypothetical protein VGY31_00670 [Terriglobia bacterium]|nr:hypothetical protein [Terriglobia bacterium]
MSSRRPGRLARATLDGTQVCRGDCVRVRRSQDPDTDRDRENRFFVESPRKLFAHLLKHHPTPEKLCYWIAHADPEIDRRVAGTPLEAIVSRSAPQQRAGMLAGLERVSNSFSLLPPPSKTRRWTATEWAERREG